MNSKIIKVTVFIALAAALVVTCFFYARRINSYSANQDDRQTQAQIKSVEMEKMSTVKVLFVGDIMFDRYIRQVADRKGGDYVFAGVKNMFSGNDLVVGNLEGPITDKQSKSVDTEIGTKENYIFTFAPSAADILSKENIKLVNIGNNHIGNFGKAGIESTRNYLTEAGIGFFGDPEKESNWMTIKEINGFKIAFINYNQFVANGKQRTLNDIKRAKNPSMDLIVLYTHWGTEFVSEPSDKIKNLAHEFIDSGADLIIGTHPHVVQSKEEYKGKTIYYSLGNFVFDQYFDPKTQEGLAVQVQISPDKKMNFQEYRVRMKTNGQTVKEQ